MKSIFYKIITVAVAFAILASTIGTLVLPVVMVRVFTPCWLFLYVGYLIIALNIAFAFCDANSKHERRGR